MPQKNDGSFNGLEKQNLDIRGSASRAKSTKLRSGRLGCCFRKTDHRFVMVQPQIEQNPRPLGSPALIQQAFLTIRQTWLGTKNPWKGATATPKRVVKVLSCYILFSKLFSRILSKFNMFGRCYSLFALRGCKIIWGLCMASRKSEGFGAVMSCQVWPPSCGQFSRENMEKMIINHHQPLHLGRGPIILRRT